MNSFNTKARPMVKNARQRRPLAAYRLRRDVAALEARMDREDRRHPGDPLFDEALELYADWAPLAHPEPLYRI